MSAPRRDKNWQPGAAPSSELPSNLDAERLVLGCALLGRNFGEIRKSLGPLDFSLERHRRIFSGMIDIDDRGDLIDHVMVAHQLKQRGELENDGLSCLLDLTDGVPELPSLNGHLRNLKDISVLRNTAIAAKELSESCCEHGQDPARVRLAAQRLLRGLGAESESEQSRGIPAWPRPMEEAAMHGLAGELVLALGPHTEADPAALLIQVIVAWGSLIGRGPYYLAEADRHYTNLYVNVVGSTSKARKGTSWSRVLSALGGLDPHWVEHCLLRGLGSGEAMIDTVGQDVADKRCLILEPELARLLAVISRKGCTLSANLRDGFDSGSLAIITRQNKVRVTGAHVSLIGHITQEELLRRLDRTELANGLCNRMLLGLCAPVEGASSWWRIARLGRHSKKISASDPVCPQNRREPNRNGR